MNRRVRQSAVFAWLVFVTLLGADPGFAEYPDPPESGVGGGAFETLKVVRGEAFALSRHLGRLGPGKDVGRGGMQRPPRGIEGG